MSKYIKLEDAIGYECPLNEIWEDCINCPLNNSAVEPCKMGKWLNSLPTIEFSEEDELKFYYVDSIDAYWIGRRLDNFYYAEWEDRLGFVWSKSRYLPWGEHVIAEDTLWKEHTYPSEPREIPFTEWIVGFMKKYGSKVSEDCISREEVYRAIITCGEVDNDLNHLYEVIENFPSVVPTADNLSAVEDCISREYMKSLGYINKGDFNSVETIREWIDNAPSVIPKAKGGEWIPCSERLPEDGVAVLTTTENEEVYIDQVITDPYKERYFQSNTAYDNFQVIAWMPLPKPWKGAEDA